MGRSTRPHLGLPKPPSRPFPPTSPLHSPPPSFPPHPHPGSRLQAALSASSLLNFRFPPSLLSLRSGPGSGGSLYLCNPPPGAFSLPLFSHSLLFPRDLVSFPVCLLLSPDSSLARVPRPLGQRGASPPQLRVGCPASPFLGLAFSDSVSPTPSSPPASSLLLRPFSRLPSPFLAHHPPPPTHTHANLWHKVSSGPPFQFQHHDCSPSPPVPCLPSPPSTCTTSRSGLPLNQVGIGTLLFRE